MLKLLWECLQQLSSSGPGYAFCSRGPATCAALHRESSPLPRYAIQRGKGPQITWPLNRDPAACAWIDAWAAAAVVMSHFPACAQIVIMGAPPQRQTPRGLLSAGRVQSRTNGHVVAIYLSGYRHTRVHPCKLCKSANFAPADRAAVAFARRTHEAARRVFVANSPDGLLEIRGPRGCRGSRNWRTRRPGPSAHRRKRSKAR